MIWRGPGVVLALRSPLNSSYFWRLAAFFFLLLSQRVADSRADGGRQENVSYKPVLGILLECFHIAATSSMGMAD